MNYNKMTLSTDIEITLLNWKYDNMQNLTARQVTEIIIDIIHSHNNKNKNKK